MEAVEERVDSLEKIFAQFMTRSERNSADHKARMDQFEREARQHTLEMAHIAERFGRFAEDIVAPNIPRLAREVFGITELQFSAQRVEKRHARNSARFREFDMILAGQGKLIVVETKATPRLKYIEDFAEMLKELPEYFPEWKSHAVIPIFASMAISPDFVKRLTRLRIYALALGDRTMELLNLGEVSAKRN
ncbi:MAG: hypothetical protein EXS30_08900 [Pedosphaera sp.]|nr:hypothetical protein [Pedosphaera sp.]